MDDAQIEHWFEECGVETIKIKVMRGMIAPLHMDHAISWLARKEAENQERLRRKEITDRAMDIAALIMATVAAIAAVVAAIATIIAMRN